MKLCRPPKIEGSILKYRVPPLWPTYISERRTTIVKASGINREVLWRTHWELGEHIGNLMGTHWELEGNMLGTKEKNLLPYCPPFSVYIHES
jgi:hypothetical protein